MYSTTLHFSANKRTLSFDQCISNYYNCFTCTCKERDAETGFSYYGARYYDSELSTLFLSVDPCADKYPGISPYAYCAWNPVKLVDPDGREISTHTDKNGNVLAVYNDGNLGIYTHSESEIQAFMNGTPFSNNYDQLVGSTLHENSRIGRMLGFSKTEILAKYGAFHLSNNNLGKLVSSFDVLYKQALSHPLTADGQRTFGEDPISNYFQRLGYEGINSIEKHAKYYSTIWKD